MAGAAADSAARVAAVGGAAAGAGAVAGGAASSASSASGGPYSGMAVVKVLRGEEVFRVRLRWPADLAQVRAAIAAALRCSEASAPAAASSASSSSSTAPPCAEGLRMWQSLSGAWRELDSEAAKALFGGEPPQGPAIRLRLDPPSDELEAAVAPQCGPRQQWASASDGMVADSGRPAPQLALTAGGGSVAARPGSEEDDLNRAKEASAAEARARLGRVMDLYRARLRPVAADGNCQFRALSVQLYGEEAHYAALRDRIVEQLRGHPEWYAPYVQGSFDEYLSRMERDGEWGDNVTLQAASDVLGCVVHVLTDQAGGECVEVHPRQPLPGPQQKPLCLAFVTEVHYDAAEMMDVESGF